MLNNSQTELKTSQEWTQIQQVITSLKALTHLLAIYFYNKLKEMFKWMSIISDFRNSSSSTITNKKNSFPLS